MPIHTATAEELARYWDTRPSEYGDLELARGEPLWLLQHRKDIYEARVASGQYLMLADNDGNLLFARRQGTVIYPQLYIVQPALTRVQMGHAVLLLAAVLIQRADAQWPADADTLTWELDGRPTNATVRNTIVQGFQVKGVTLTLVAPNLWHVAQTSVRGFAWP